MQAAAEQNDPALAASWRANRPYLVNLAFGMLGDIGSAEDAVQEAFERLARSEIGQIDDQRGWLIVVTSRICLDHIRSARSRRERPQETSLIEPAEPIAGGVPAVDPADRVTLDDEVGLALLVVLQRLKPAERVVFVLHDVFRTPFDTIAQTMGRPAASCRQLARRARAKIQEEADGADDAVVVAEHRVVTERFIKACSDGDLSALLELLDPDVSGDADLGPRDSRSGRVVRGRQPVAQNLLRYFGTTATMVSNPAGGGTVVLAFVEHRLLGVILLQIEQGIIGKIHVVIDPTKVGPLSARLSPA
ncbi:MAG TPA: RNA polymerase sigma factor SigI [Acidimicrobiales bacterium]|nr:RNA polymerase sigma factor SigI [Acidimicrobiales bacterium]